MANANSMCRLCRRPMVFIGISGGARPCCPKDCSECATCKHPDVELKLVKAEIVERDDGFFVTTSVCSKCTIVTTKERKLP